MLTSPLEGGIRPGRPEPVRVGRVPNDEDVRLGLSPSFDGNPAVRLVRRDDDVRQVEAEAFERAQDSIDGVTSAIEAREIDLRREIVVIEHEAGAAPFQTPHGGQEEGWGV